MPVKQLKYASPFQSFLDTSFFQELSRLKLEVLKLDSDAQEIYTKVDLSNSNDSAHLFLNGQSFDAKNSSTGFSTNINGLIFNYNTLEEFKGLDKQNFLEERSIEKMREGLIDVNKSVGFSIISFSDLKKYKFVYWVCFPCFQMKGLEINVVNTTSMETSKSSKKWLKENPSSWVGICDSEGAIFEYSKENMHDSSSIVIRDTSRMKNIPSALAKNFLTIFKMDHPKHDKVDVLFLREDSSSFKMTLQFDVIGNSSSTKLKTTGWERNSLGKLAPHAVDLSTLIDPLKIAEQSVDLNLKLMKWRIAPELNLNIIKDSKVLLLGAGTLGCYVARSLMAWGVRKITLVDNSTVSLSNPVRQPLYEFTDNGKPKAQAAADHLKKIFPLLDATGINLSVPMIGHSISNSDTERKSYEQLKGLIKGHDVVFLLMDSRETRWLPSVLANIEDKIVINAALGFDSYLVMRHGNYHGSESNRLGCYFCNDVVAPTDSLADRTLDQMCTVTRPGVALMAASQAVELWVSILQSEKRNNIGPDEKTILGDVPHQIRGFLNNFSTLKLETPAYEYCSACSVPIIEACKEQEWDFLQNALTDPKFVERLSGLEKVQKDVERMTDNTFDWSDEGEEGFDIID